tara:strand:+ start:150 stop:866 length:717 start_codon:yes stop_codon:yes gene_type:complete
LSPSGTPTPNFNPYLDLYPTNTTATVNSSQQLVISGTSTALGVKRHFGVNGNIQNGTGFLTGYANRNVFTVDYVAAPSFLNSAKFGIELDSQYGGYFFIRQQFVSGPPSRYDLRVLWRQANSGGGSGQGYVKVLSSVAQSAILARYQLVFYNPVYIYSNVFIQTIDFDWEVYKDGVSVATSAANTKLRFYYNQIDLCNNTTYEAEVLGNTNITIDNFGIGLNGNLSCLPAASPAPPPP